MIYEYRVYETMPGKLPELNARFRNHTLKLFERHGIKSIGYWSGRVRRVLRPSNLHRRLRESRTAGSEPWASFSADPEWPRVVAESEANGPLISPNLQHAFSTPPTTHRYSREFLHV